MIMNVSYRAILWATPVGCSARRRRCRCWGRRARSQTRTRPGSEEISFWQFYLLQRFITWSSPCRLSLWGTSAASLSSPRLCWQQLLSVLLWGQNCEMIRSEHEYTSCEHPKIVLRSNLRRHSWLCPRNLPCSSQKACSASLLASFGLPFICFI